MAYNHGIRVQENATSLPAPVMGTSGLQVVFGTAPVNMASDPYNATNKLILASSFTEAKEQLGYVEDFANYTLCQSMDTNFKIFQVAPVIFCNVLDPERHVTVNQEVTATVSALQVTVEKTGILLDKLTVTDAESQTVLTKDVDYIASFASNGYVLITLSKSGAGAGATRLTVGSTSIDPSLVTINDIIGGVDVSTGQEKGIELVRRVYPQFGYTPGLLLAPGWSHNPEVGAALVSKSTEINGIFSCENLIDLDTTKAKKYTDCKAVKEAAGFTSERSLVLWPKIKISTKTYAYSAVMGALIAYMDATNDDVPNLSPSNKLLGATGTVLEDGTEVVIDQPQANSLNGYGIVTAINTNGYRTWGNNTACYDSDSTEEFDPKDRWFCCRRFFSWWGNSFIVIYSEKVDDPGNYRLIQSIVDSENIRGNSYASQGKCAGAKIEYLAEENSINDVLNGKIQFRQYLAPYTPAEDILNVLEFDPNMLQAALGGE